MPVALVSFLSSLHLYTDWSLLLLRIVLGCIFIGHGFPKFKNLQGFSAGVGIPVWLGFLVAVFETLGGIDVLLGLKTQIGAMMIAIVMLGTLKFKIFTWNNKFIESGKAGWEYDAILFCVAIALVTLGGGAFSIDRMWLGL